MQAALRRAIIICALGYFIDVFDIQLFAVLRVPSLTEMGVVPGRLAAVGGNILNAQMLGMILGGFLWGYLGDRLGRLKALYGSILVYSLGTLACTLVHDPLTYRVFRFITGFGLAGETGAAITLIAELMTREKRGWGIALIAGFGMCGPVAAVFISWLISWRMTYLVAGSMGLILLILRMGLIEPALFQKISANDHRGSWKLLIQPKQALIFLCCLAVGLPSIYSVSILNFFSLELGVAVVHPGQIFSQKISLLLFYIGLGMGSAAAGVITQLWQSRRKSVAVFFSLGAIAAVFYLLAGPRITFSAATIYGVYFLVGAASGSWILAATIAGEHFGTNIRATTSIVLTNLMRGFTIPMIFAFQCLRGLTSITAAAAIIGFFIYAAAFLALRRLRETHGIDLDYVEGVVAEPSAGR